MAACYFNLIDVAAIMGLNKMFFSTKNFTANRQALNMIRSLLNTLALVSFSLLAAIFNMNFWNLNVENTSVYFSSCNVNSFCKPSTMKSCLGLKPMEE